MTIQDVKFESAEHYLRTGLLPDVNWEQRRDAVLSTAVSIRPDPRDGFIRVVDLMGNDLAVEEAARVSYARETRAVSETKGLIEYLLQHEHTTPFEQAVIKIHFRAPIFVVRQWIRHRTMSFNEQSARYSVMDDWLWIPQLEDLAPQSSNNKQGRSGKFDIAVGQEIIALMQSIGTECVKTYHRLLGQDKVSEADWHDDLHYLTQRPEYEGLAREMARIVMPLNAMTELYMTVDLHNMLRFLNLRMDLHAQKEIRDYANVIGHIVQQWCPISWAAFDNAFLRGARLTGRQLDVIRHILRMNGVNFPSFRQQWKDNGHSLREFDRLVGVLNQPTLEETRLLGSTPQQPSRIIRPGEPRTPTVQVVEADRPE